MLKAKTIASAIAASSLMLSTFATTAFADTTIELTGNGASSSNAAAVSNTQTTTVVQNNDAHVTNNVSSNANTGDNDASFNTGGNTVVDTGSAHNTTNVSTTANLNKADISNCNCAQDAEVLIGGNGASSTNTATLNQNNQTTAFQNNDAYIKNNVDSNANSGGNSAGFNTGGDVVVFTGNATNDTTVRNTANANLLSIGGGAGAGAGGTVSLRILDNGALSHNSIALANNPTTSVVQDNKANVYNHVNSDANTGDNDASFNTAGDVIIHTGAASDTTRVDNLVNFNSADVDCGCLLDTLAKIHGNGALSYNTIAAALGGATNIYQGGKGAGNDAYLNNYVDSGAKTGYNDAGFNTGDSDSQSDPAILTGSADSDTSVHNTGNVNLVGDGLHLPGGAVLGLSLDWSGLFGLLNL